MKLAVPVVAASLLFLPAVAAQSQCSEAEKARLEEFDRMWGDATTRGDRARLQMIYADDYGGTNLTNTQTKAEAIDGSVRAAEVARASAQPAPNVVFDHYVITCTPTSAVVTHRNSVTTTVDGRDQTSYSRSIHILEKRGGRWVVVGNTGHGLTDNAIVSYLEQDWNNAELKRDYAWFERHVAPDALLIGSRTGALDTRSQLIAAMRADKEVTTSIDMTDLNVRVDGNMAQGTALLHLKGRDAQGRPFERRVRFIDTFMKRDGRWMFVSSQGTSVP